jgi:hypothetical protein
MDDSLLFVVAIGWPSESGRYAADSPRRSHSVPASHAVIWMGAASAPSCGVGGVRGRQRSAISASAWDGRSRRAAQAWPGPGVRSERYMCGCVRCAAESRRTAAARSGIIGLMIRDSSCRHRMAVGIRQVCGRLSAAKPLGSSLAGNDLDGCCLCAKLWARGRPWATAKRDFAVRMGRPFAASGASVART